jgi:hypothetical protein
VRKAACEFRDARTQTGPKARDRATTRRTRSRPLWMMRSRQFGDDDDKNRGVGKSGTRRDARARAFERPRGVSRTSPSPHSERSRAGRRGRRRAVACAGSRS